MPRCRTQIINPQYHDSILFVQINDNQDPNLNNMQTTETEFNPNNNSTTTFPLNDIPNDNLQMTQHIVQLLKPMGIILEEDMESSPGVVTIAKIDPNGNTATTSSSFQKNGMNQDVCIHDQILEINGISCRGQSLEQVMEKILESSSSYDDDDDDGGGTNQITITLGRKANQTIVEFSNGIKVSANSGEPLSQLAKLAYMRIPYSCDSGGCGTCEQIMCVSSSSSSSSSSKTNPNPNPTQLRNSDEMTKSMESSWDSQRYVRPCVARVPKGMKRIALFPSDRFESS